MKYINREYGFEGRPPFFKDFIEESSSVPFADKVRYRNDPVAGFGLHYDVLNGVTVAGALGTVWGMKFTYQKNGKWLEDSDFIVDAARYFAGDIGHRFRYIYHGDVMVSLVKYSKSAVALSFSALKRTRIKITFYCQAGGESNIKLAGNVITASAKERGVILGDYSLTDALTVIKGRYEAYNTDASAKKEYAIAALYGGGEGAFSTYDNEVDYEAVIDNENARVLGYIAVEGADTAREVPSEQELLRGINAAELTYSAEKTVGSGKLCEHAADIVSGVSAHKIYNPLRLAANYIESRENLGKDYAYEPTEAAAAGLVSALVADSNRDQLSAYAGEIILGAVSNWIAFCRTRDKKILADAYPKWMLRWNIDAKLVQTDPAVKREIGYKMPLSPLKDTLHEPVYSLEFNSYKLIALEIMEHAARILDRAEKEQIKAVYYEFKKKVKETLFNDKLGLFMDRYVSGAFTFQYGATSFLPLLGGAVEDNDTLNKLLINLSDHKKFRGACPLPTISRDNASYGKKARRMDGTVRQKFNDYTGSALPYLNYLVYLGLVRVGANEAAADFALQNAKIWKAYYDIYGIVPSIALPNYKLDEKATYNALSGNLFGLIAVSELVDAEYFGSDLSPSLRFGTFAPGNHRITNLKLWNKKISVNAGKRLTELIVDGRKVLEGAGGEFLVRYLTEKEKGCKFLIYAKESVTIALNLPLFTQEGARESYKFNVEAGKFRISVSGGNVKAERLV